MKIQIMGFSGSGKSTLAKSLSEYYNIPILYLDNVKFYGDWQERTKEEQEKIVSDFINENDNWIIDGNYLNLVPSRFIICDTIIFLDFNRFFCLDQAFKRYKKHKGKVRESCGAEEKMDFEFFWWLIFRSRTRKRRRKMFERFNDCTGNKHLFKNRKSLHKYLKENKIDLIV